MAGDAFPPAHRLSSDVTSTTQTQWPSTTVTTPSDTPTSTSFDLLSPIYLTIGPIFVVALFVMIWLLMVPNVRRPWSCRSHRKSTVIALRQRGPGDAYEINPDMWRGGGRFVGESTLTRGEGNTHQIHEGFHQDASPADLSANTLGSEVEDGMNGACQADRPPSYSPMMEQSRGTHGPYEARV